MHFRGEADYSAKSVMHVGYILPLIIPASPPSWDNHIDLCHITQLGLAPFY